MKPFQSFVVRHKRMLLIALLTVTLLVSSEANRRAALEAAAVTALPVNRVSAEDAVAVYTEDRDVAHDLDMAALLALVENEATDPQTRQSAAMQIQTMISDRHARQAIEEALAGTSLAPCAVVVAGGSVTLVTAKTEITRDDSALVLTLAAAHAGAAPGDVRILTVP